MLEKQKQSRVLEVLSDKQISITYKESTPSLLTGGVWTYPLAKHIFGDMDVAKMSSSKEVREKPIGFGPFKVDASLQVSL